ncbi:MAG: hypothetical protein JXA66_02215 [Oligoflexia bacterium]|nr:hypothetical protein [Oligoflexia bacterium]
MNKQNKKPLTTSRAVELGREKFIEIVTKMFEEKNLWRLPYKTREEQEKAEKHKKVV